MVQIRRWLNQKGIGYIKERYGKGALTHDVVEGEVEMDDGTVCMAWIVTPLPRLKFRNGETMFSYGEVTYTKPHIDYRVGDE